MVSALLFDPSSRSIQQIAFNRSLPSSPFSWAIFGAACVDGVHPNDFAAAASILDVEDPLKVAVYTVSAKGNHDYKIWVRPCRCICLSPLASHLHK
jgi:hypothetical protein